MENYLINHLYDLAEQSLRQNRGLDSDFLSPEEASQFLKRVNDFAYAEPKLFDDDWERKLIHFGPGDPEVDILLIRSKASSFVDLRHPDYLGALLGLGLERRVIGDIIADRERALVFVKRQVSAYILDRLDSVGWAPVTVIKLEGLPEDAVNRFQLEEHVVSSLRLDRFISTIFRLPRKEATQAIEKGLIFIDGLEENKIHRTVSEGERISFRRKGKVQFLSILRTTKKDSSVIQIKRFV